MRPVSSSVLFLVAHVTLQGASAAATCTMLSRDTYEDAIGTRDISSARSAFCGLSVVRALACPGAASMYLSRRQSQVEPVPIVPVCDPVRPSILWASNQPCRRN